MSDEFKGHTPGPWGVEPRQAHGTRVTAIAPVAWCGTNMSVGANGCQSISEEQAYANARLIAAAPDLLAERDALRARVAELEAAWEAWEAAWTGAASAEDEAAAWEAAWEAEAAWAEAAKKSQEAELRRVCKELEGK